MRQSCDAAHLCSFAACAAIAVTGCEGSQAVLDASGPHAAATQRLAWLLFGGAAVILIGVGAAVVLAVVGRARAREILARDTTVIAGGAVLPIVTLSALLVHGLRTTAEVAGDEPAALALEVVGQQWWWRVRYLDTEGRRSFETANEIRVPVGQPVELRLTSADVIHSFWVPRLAGKLDMIPGRVNRLRIQADRPGVYRGQCAEFCGGAHALMALHVVAEEQEDFEAWRARQTEPGLEPVDAEATRGRDVFLERGCGLCHRVGGTRAAGRFGPDLTHVGGRLHVVSGMLPNHRGTLAGWIASAQRIKPENRMPSFESLAAADLRALATYLDGLQ